MKISLNWIKEFVDIPNKHSAKTLAELLTLRTCEVEEYEDQRIKFANMIVGKCMALRPHPNADKLRLSDTDIGGGKIVQIVCGGKNLAAGMIVPVALPGSVVNWHGAGEMMELKETKIRGEKSFGMICAGEEIGLPPVAPECITDLGVMMEKLGLAMVKPGTSLAEALGFDDIIFEIDNKSLTHRPDLWSHYGMAREFAAFLNKKLRNFIVHGSFPKTGVRMKVDIEHPDICRRFLSAAFENIKVERSPAWLAKRLEAVGMRPVNNIVDITNYVMHELGQPLHAFDRTVVGTDHFVIRLAKNGEEITTLDHKKRNLTMEDVLVTNGKISLALAGVMGGVNSEITPKTTDIVLEAATWNPVLIRKTSSRQGLRSDAAQRFEKSLDPEYTGIAFHRACELILKICQGARLAGPATDVYPRRVKLQTVIVSPAMVEHKIGARIPEKEMADHLKALQFGVKKGPKGTLRVTVPSFRATKDINIEDDITEEIARMHGYEKIAPALPKLPIQLPRPNIERSLKHRARDIFSLGLGFTETMRYSFYGKSDVVNCMLPEAAHVIVANPLNEDQTHLRVSLLPNLLRAVALNQSHHAAMKMYEIGKTYIAEKKYFPREEKFICGVVADLRQAQTDKKEIFYDALGALQAFLNQFRAKNVIVLPAGTPPPYAHPKKCAVVEVGETKARLEIAVVYEVHPQVLKNFGIEIPVAAFEINFSKLVAAGQNDITYAPLPRFPGIEIDISVLVPKKTPAREVHELIRVSGGALVSRITIIDIFEDANLGEGKKSFTFRVLLQSPERTLTDPEMKTVQEKIFKNLRGAEFIIRGE